MSDEQPSGRRRVNYLDWIVMALMGVAIATYVLTGVVWWATLVWVVVFAVPGFYLLERMLTRQWLGGELLGPLVFGVMLVSWAVLGTQ